MPRYQHPKDFLSSLTTLACPICDEPLDSTHPPVMIEDCRHVFGAGCLKTWVESDNHCHNKCPMCRKTLFDYYKTDQEQEHFQPQFHDYAGHRGVTYIIEPSPRPPPPPRTLRRRHLGPIAHVLDAIAKQRPRLESVFRNLHSNLHDFVSRMRTDRSRDLRYDVPTRLSRSQARPRARRPEVVRRYRAYSIDGHRVVRENWRRQYQGVRVERAGLEEGWRRGEVSAGRRNGMGWRAQLRQRVAGGDGGAAVAGLYGG